MKGQEFKNYRQRLGFERVHLDSTQLDILLKSRQLGTPIGRPWLTLAIDEGTYRVLAFHLTFDPPSQQSCMAVLRIVKRLHGRLPERLVVDSSKEFSGGAFETLAARYGVVIEKVPLPKSVVRGLFERIFAKIHSQLFQRSFRTTSKMQADVRCATKRKYRARRACWTLAELDRLIGDYVHKDRPIFEEQFSTNPLNNQTEYS